jgi:dTDP-glucose 4,6-dehydratase
LRVLITGGAGFIGSHLCDYLLDRGHDVVCMDNLITGSLDNISHIHHENFKFYKYDVTEFIYLDGGVDFVLHFASPASPLDYQRFPIQTLKVGALGTHKTLGFAKSKGASYLFASSSEVYGDPHISPQSEDYWGNVNPIGPRGVYDEAKRFAEAMVMAYHYFHKMDTRIARIFNTYGPRMRRGDGRVVPTFIEQALLGKPLTVFGDGTQTRSFCYISDLIDGIYRLLLTPISEPVNLGSPDEISIMELAEKVIELTGTSSRIIHKPLPADDPRIRKPDVSKARKLLGWEASVSLDDGLKETISWFRSKWNK